MDTVLFLWRNEMAKLPDRNILNGNKTPKTTTGEMKDALGKLRDYLNDLLGDDSTDKEAARQALGIDLTELANRIEAKADQQAIEVAIQGKADKSDVESKIQELEEAIAKRGTPIGSIEYFAMAVPPAGYLKADGAVVGRETYPDLFDAIGTTFGAGDGVSTFNLPDLIDRFAQGSLSPGQKIEAGLPNIEAFLPNSTSGSPSKFTGAAYRTGTSQEEVGLTGGSAWRDFDVAIDASRSSPVYGAADTVQPPALTLLPCIKAFDAAANPGLLDMTGLANDVSGLSANKLDKTIGSKTVRYVIDAFGDGTNWWREWSDGWVEQGGNGKSGETLVFMVPFANTSYTFLPHFKLAADSNLWGYTIRSASPAVTSIYVATGDNGRTTTGIPFSWYACGQGV